MSDIDLKLLARARADMRKREIERKSLRLIKSGNVRSSMSRLNPDHLAQKGHFVGAKRVPTTQGITDRMRKRVIDNEKKIA